jgi:hypothetical protein
MTLSPLTYLSNVCVSAVVPFRSRVLSHCLPRASRGNQTWNEDKTLYQLVTAPLQKHSLIVFSMCSFARSNVSVVVL